MSHCQAVQWTLLYPILSFTESIFSNKDLLAANSCFSDSNKLCKENIDDLWSWHTVLMNRNQLSHNIVWRKMLIYANRLARNSQKWHLCCFDYFGTTFKQFIVTKSPGIDRRHLSSHNTFRTIIPLEQWKNRFLPPRWQKMDKNVISVVSIAFLLRSNDFSPSKTYKSVQSYHVA